MTWQAAAVAVGPLLMRFGWGEKRKGKEENRRERTVLYTGGTFFSKKKYIFFGFFL